MGTVTAMAQRRWPRSRRSFCRISADGVPLTAFRSGNFMLLLALILLLVLLWVALRASAQILPWRYQPNLAVRLGPASEAVFWMMRREPLRFPNPPGAADLMAVLRAAPL